MFKEKKIRAREFPFDWMLLGAVAGAVVALAAWLQKSAVEPRVEKQLEETQRQAEELRTETKSGMESQREDVEPLLHRARRELNDLYAQAEDFIEDARLRGQIARKKAEIKRLEAQRRIRRIA